MKRHGEPLFWEDDSDIPHLHRISAVQFIETSTIVCHPLPLLKAVYVNVFSCKEFDTELAKRYCAEYWNASSLSFTRQPQLKSPIAANASVIEANRVQAAENFLPIILATCEAPDTPSMSRCVRVLVTGRRQSIISGIFHFQTAAKQQATSFDFSNCLQDCPVGRNAH